jgi:hypothetical protein
MQRSHVYCAVGLAAMLLVASASRGADQYGLSKGTPDLQSADVLAFGPDGVLFVGDTKSAAIFAIQTGEISGDPEKADYNVEGLNVRIAEALGASSQGLTVNDIAVSPLTGALFVAVTADDAPALVRISGDNEVSAFSLQRVPFAKAELPNPPPDKVIEGRRPRNYRPDSITDLAYAETQLLVSGMNGDLKSSVWTFAFPFSEFDAGTTLEIYHASHNREEDAAAMRTFVPFTIGGEPQLLASYVCTPLVKFPLSELQAGERVHGTTVAELGNHNQPLDMIVYRRDGADYLLLINSARGTMKISTDDIEKNSISEHVADGGTAGQTYETIEELSGAVQLALLNDEHAVVLLQHEDGPLNLRTVELP